MKSTDIRIAIFFTILLVGMGITQPGILEHPQKIMIVWGGILLILKALKEKNISSAMLYIVLGVLSYNVIFWCIGSIANLLNPDDGWIEHNGERRRVMSLNWIWGGLAGIILSPIIVVKYHYSVNRNKMLELIFAACLVIITTTIFIKYKI